MTKLLINVSQDDRLIKASGIYFIKLDKQILYIGQSTNLKNRLKAHANVNVRLNDFNKRLKQCSNDKYKPGIICNINKYLYFKNHLSDLTYEVIFTDANNLNKLEEYYIAKYQPIFNYSGVITQYTPRKMD